MSLSFIKIRVMTLCIVCSVGEHLNNQDWASRANRWYHKSGDGFTGPGEWSYHWTTTL